MTTFIEGRNIDIIELISDYEMSRGSRTFSHKIGGNCVWNLQIIGKELGGTLDGTITVKGSNQIEDPTYYNTYAGLSPVDLDSATLSSSIEDFMCTHEYIIFELNVGNITSGTLTLLLKIKET
jgi:hypothetical protein